MSELSPELPGRDQDGVCPPEFYCPEVAQCLWSGWTTEGTGPQYRWCFMCARFQNSGTGRRLR